MVDDNKISITNLVCLTYQANNYVTPYHFIGKTEEEAREKFKDWLKKDRGGNNGPVKSNEVEVITPVIKDGVAGKLWMINHRLKDRQRVSPSQVAEFQAKGYVQGGPRTQFR